MLYQLVCPRNNDVSEVKDTFSSDLGFKYHSPTKYYRVPGEVANSRMKQVIYQVILLLCRARECYTAKQNKIQTKIHDDRNK